MGENVSVAAASASSANRKRVRVSGWPIGAQIPGVAFLHWQVAPVRVSSFTSIARGPEERDARVQIVMSRGNMQIALLLS